jgi:hypothetical protein
MIKTKHLVVLAVVLVVLGAVSFWQRESYRQSTSSTASVTLIEGDWTKDNLGRIVFGYGENAEQVVLAATPTGWVVQTHWNSPASDQRIDSLLRELSNLSGEFRSDSAEVLADYGLVPEQALRISAFDKNGDPAFVLDVGRTPEGTTGSFISLPDDDAVYLSQKNVLAQLGLYSGPEAPQGRYFLELAAVKEDRLNVDRIILQDGDQTIAMSKEFAITQPAADDTTGAGPQLDRSTWEWKLEQPRSETLAKTKADRVLNSLVSLRATDVDDPQIALADYGLDQPTRTATMVFPDGRETVVLFGGTRPAVADQPAGTWMQIQGQPTVWVVTEYTPKNIFKTVEELLPD